MSGRQTLCACKNTIWNLSKEVSFEACGAIDMLIGFISHLLGPQVEYYLCGKGGWCVVVACSFKSVEDNFMWELPGIYLSNLDSDRSLLWEEIAVLHSWWNLSWCIGGDFNVIRFLSER